MKALTLFYRITSLLLRCRYRVRYQGLEVLDSLKEAPGGVLFLANHASYADPLVLAKLFARHPARLTVRDKTFYLPGAAAFLHRLGALPIPSFDHAPNTYKQYAYERAFSDMVDGLNRGESFLVFPAGRLKWQAKEVIGGASGTYDLLQRDCSPKVVLIRIRGMWGSSFSQAFGGNLKPLEILRANVLRLLRGGIFFLPKRPVSVELALRDCESLKAMSRAELNQYLEAFFNQPPQDELKWIPFSRWRSSVPVPDQRSPLQRFELSDVSEDIVQDIATQVASLASLEVEALNFNASLSKDLGLDSLDMAQLVTHLSSRYKLEGISSRQFETTRDVIGLAAGQLKLSGSHEIEERVETLKVLDRHVPRLELRMPDVDNVLEAILDSCDHFDKQIACGDLVLGDITYRRMKFLIVLVAQMIRQSTEDKYIGIMLPASVMSAVCVYATLLAGRVPVMLNWTVGSVHTDSLIKQTGMNIILTSWKFLDKVDDLGIKGHEDKIHLLDDWFAKLRFRDMLQAKRLACFSRTRLLKFFSEANIDPDAVAVLLFTSGSTQEPKGVPLTHKNLMANTAHWPLFHFCAHDVLLGFLPAFHAFGFSGILLMPLIVGVRVVFFPKPTAYQAIGQVIKKWEVTKIASPPLFLAGLLDAVNADDLKSVTSVISGAEKMPETLYHRIRALPGRPVYLEGYGITECSPGVSLNVNQGLENGVGRIVPGLEVLFVDPETLKPTEKPEGLLLVRGDNVFHGYLGGGSEGFLEIDGKRWYNTGDVAYLNDSDCLILVGRERRCVKIGGEMISYAALESHLEQSLFPHDEPGSALSVVVMAREAEKTTLVAFSVGDVSVDAMNKALRSKGFSNLMKITDVIHVDQIPLLGSGKIDYRTLKTML